jgi:eukaryotic-like serine/threonine-protein kinase
VSLSPGTRLGAFEIVDAIGAGGMGEVYRARDTKLGRSVALKVLPSIFASDPERLARFAREARMLAGLNHPHIAQLHGFEDSAGTPVLVMELVEGEDLSNRLARGRIPVDEALAIAKQIAEALEAAHERGIVHRDLKPANIKVREDGTVKVLDFGLAKALEGSSAADGTSGAGGTRGQAPLNSPTITTPAMTLHGVILGTAAYMAPEQAKGKVVDKRADIWAFGAVLFEMVTGRRAFAGDDVSDTLASVLRADVDWTDVPPSVVRLLKKCLERDPKRRLHDIADAWDLLADVPAGPVPETTRLRWLAWGIAGLLLVATIGLAFVHFRESTPAADVVRFQIQAPPKNVFDIYLALSPNGRRLAFTARDETGILRLWVRDLDTLEARPLPGTEEAGSPFWAPDSRSLAFGINRTLKRIDVSGGPAQTIGEAPAVVGTGTWNRDGVILFGLRGGGPVLRVAASGGVPTPVTSVEASRQETFHSFPHFLADGRRFLYYRQSNTPELQGIYAGALDLLPNQQSTSLIVATTMGNSALVADPSGHQLVFYRNGTLMAQRFDIERLQVAGEAVPIAERVGSSGSFGFFAASPTGVLMYRTGTSSSANLEQLTWLDRKGQPAGTIGEPRPIALGAGSPALAPDGSHAVVAIAPTPGPDLWLLEFARGIVTRFTFDPSADINPIWSPDGSRVVFRANRRGSGDLYVKDVNGTSDETAILQTPEPETPTDWSPDGRHLLLFRNDPKTGLDIWVLPLEGSETPQPVLTTSFNESGARFSPDGHWIAYTSNESGRPEVYLRSFVMSADGKPTVGAKWQVSTDSGTTPHWRRDGKELVYRHPSGAMMSVDVTVQGIAIRTSTPRRLFSLPLTVVNWDLSADGQRFLVSLPVAVPTSDPISAALNWQASRTP